MGVFGFDLYSILNVTLQYNTMIMWRDKWNWDVNILCIHSLCLDTDDCEPLWFCLAVMF